MEGRQKYIITIILFFITLLYVNDSDLPLPNEALSLDGINNRIEMASGKDETLLTIFGRSLGEIV